MASAANAAALRIGEQGLGRDGRSVLLAMAPALLIILGVKLLLVHSFGSDTPFWDQWDAEAARLYKPFIEGHLTFNALVASHNEHRIFFTRILGLVELELFGQWSPRFQMAVNAFLHVATVALFLWLVLRPLEWTGRVAVLVGTALFFVLPFDWENTLSGFQSQFYLVFGFSLVALKLYQSADGLSLRWWAAVAVSLMAYFSMASGLVALSAAIGLSIAQMAFGSRKRSPREFAALLLLAAMSAGELHFISHVAAHGSLEARSLGDFVRAFGLVAAWPLPAALAVVINIPAFLLVAHLVRRRPPNHAFGWLLLALLVWLAAQWLLLAYGRAALPTSSRYLDILVLGPILNIAAAAYLFGPCLRTLALIRQDRRCLLVAVASLAILATVLMFAARLGLYSFEAAETTGAHYAAQTKNLAAFMATGDISHIENKPFLDVPYPDPQRLASLAMDPSIRSILVPALTGAPPRRDLLLTRLGLTPALRAAARLVLDLGAAFVGAGTLMLVLLVSLRWRARSKA